MRQAIIIKPVCRDSPVYLYHSLALPPLGYLAFGSCNFGNLLDPMGATPRTPSPWSCCAFWCQALKTSMLPRTGIFGAIYFNISTFQHQVVDVLLWIPNFLSTPSLIPDSGLVPTLRKPKMEPGCTLMDCPLSESKVTACCYWKLIKP